MSRSGYLEVNSRSKSGYLEQCEPGSGVSYLVTEKH